MMPVLQMSPLLRAKMPVLQAVLLALSNN
jgi:hypothetical protein